MFRLLIDENFDQHIIRGLRLRFEQLDYVLVNKSGMSGATDQELLEWAASEARIIITHDANTMSQHANARLKEGRPMLGLIIVPDHLEIGRVIRDLEVIIECGTESDLRDQIHYLPL